VLFTDGSSAFTDWSLIGRATRATVGLVRPFVPLAFAFAAAACGALPPVRATAQTTVLRGTVRTRERAPVDGANVFLLQTLEGALSDSAGAFAITTAQRGSATLVVRRVGFRERRLAVTLPADTDLVVTLEAAAIQLAPISVEASSYKAADQPGVALTALQVVTTPGAAADVFRAIQTFPGLQAVDEGAGLFVRGGDVSETKTLINDATVLSPYRYESPTGGFFGSFDPFLLDGIAFSSGGFGARYGDALSGVAALNTLGRPTRSSIGLTASLAAVSASGALTLPAGLGLRATATRSNTALMFRLNGTSQDFTQVPEGEDLSASAAWQYRKGGEVKVFALSQSDRFGVVVDQPAFSGAYDADESHSLVVASWRDVIGRFSHAVSVARAGSHRSQSYGAFQLDNGLGLTQAQVRSGFAATGWLTLTAGADLEHRTDDAVGTYPGNSYDSRPAARVVKFASDLAGNRYALFAEGDLQIGGRVRATLGLRSDRSTLTRTRTWDPRLALALRLSGAATLTGAWGQYHQVPSPLMYEPTIGDPTLGPMRATHWILGWALETHDVMLRVEAYLKRYLDLAQLTRDNRVAGGGTGTSHGLDVFLKWNRELPVSGRIAYSYVHATRTDPDTRLLARSPFDVTHSITAVAERGWGQWHTSLAWRYATGRPFTPVIAATPDTAPGVWIPQYGAPESVRLPAFQRLDLSVSWLRSLWHGNLTILFVGVSNALDRDNLYGYRYRADYTQRIPVRSQFKRSVYFGVTLQQ
jgi:vitamin B12 transporter